MAEQGSCRIVGISMSEEGARLRPEQTVSTSISEISTQTAGKIFVGFEIESQGEIRMGLAVDDTWVPAFQNEMEGVTNLVGVEGEVKSYAFDLPMRIIGNESVQFPKDYSIAVWWGKPDLRDVGFQGKQVFTLRITGKGPVVKYNPKMDSD